MPVVVNRGSANVDAQRLPINRLENFDGVGEGVEEPNGHPGRSLVRRNFIANRAHRCWHDPHPNVFNDRTSTGRVLTVPKLAGGSSVSVFPGRAPPHRGRKQPNSYCSNCLISAIVFPFQWRVKLSSEHRLTLRMRST